jgi:ParB family transcriptional regulator, chromosome partitioning protein
LSTKTSKGLGRGFDTLIPQNFDQSLLLDDSEKIKKLPLNEIEAYADQPRKHFDEEALKQLSSSIKRYGILQPLVVTPSAKGYTIIAGERRFRAATAAGLTHVPAIVRSTKELEQLEIALVENVQRVDLSPLEQAVSIARLHDQFSLSYEEIAGRLGKAATTVNNIVRLLQLPQAARDALSKGQISEGHARSILALKDMPDKQTELLELIQQQGWSVRQAEQFVTACKRGAPTAKAAQTRTRSESPETLKLSKQLNTPVRIKHMAKGGQLLITFRSDKDLARIVEAIAEK